MKKLIYFVMCLSLLLLVPNKVYAQSVSPQAIGTGMPYNLRGLDYEGFEFVQEHSSVYEYIVTYSLPYKYVGNVGVFDYVLYYKWEASFTRGSINYQRNSYVLEDIISLGDMTEFRFRITLLKSVVDDSYSGNVQNILLRDSTMYVKFDDISEILRDYFYRISPSKRPENLYQVGMAYSTGSAYAGRLYWRLQDYIDISNYIEDYNLFLSYTTVSGADLYALYFYGENKNLIAWVDKARLGDIYKFENENRFVVSMFNFEDVDTGNYINWNNVKYMRFEFLTEPYPDSSVLINLTNTLDISIGEYWRTAEAFNSYYQAGYEEGFNIGYGRGQELINDEILEMLEKEYQRGYNAGMNDNFNVFSYLEALFGEQGLGRLLRLELLPGVSLGAVIMIPLAFWLVSFIMRWFR